MVAQLGGSPTFAQLALVRRAARTLLQLELLDRKFSSGNFTILDSNVQGCLANNFKLTMRELGLRPAAGKPKPTLGEYLAGRQADNAQG